MKGHQKMRTKNILKKVCRPAAVLLAVILLLGMLPAGCFAEEGTPIRILYTGDIHSNFQNAARYKTLIDELSGENTVYFDSGDIAMGTLLQSCFSTDAFELRLLGKLGCDVLTVGNHEWDYGGFGFAKELHAAKESGDSLPLFVLSNIDFSGELSEEQKAVKEALQEYGSEEYQILHVGGKSIAVFGLLGINAIDDAPTSGMVFTDYITAAKETVQRIQEQEHADCIVCLSHSGTSGDGSTGEDFDLLEAVPDIDIVISGHSHTEYPDGIIKNGSILVSSGENMNKLGVLDIELGDDGVRFVDNQLISIDESILPDKDVEELLAEANVKISESYLADYHEDPDTVIAHSSFDFISLDEMYATQQEYPLGNLIADSYLYEAEQNGITDIDIAMVGLGTIRGSIPEGDITTADAFEICSLGVGADGSAGHPIIAGYATGKEIKLLAELDASLGSLMSSIKMSYAGLRLTYNEKRMILDRITDIQLVRKDGTEEPLEDDKLYKIAANMYAANMLGMVNDLTRGILSISIKDVNGNPVENYYDLSLKTKDGKEIKEWVAFKDYLRSFDKENGVPEIPENLYGAAQGRKASVSESGIAAITHPGLGTWLLIGAILLVLLILFLLILLIRRILRKTKKHNKK